jgi:hypothetical protein
MDEQQVATLVDDLIAAVFIISTETQHPLRHKLVVLQHTDWNAARGREMLRKWLQPRVGAVS